MKHIATLAQNVLEWIWSPRPGNLKSCVLILTCCAMLGLSLNLSSLSIILESTLTLRSLSISLKSTFHLSWGSYRKTALFSLHCFDTIFRIITILIRKFSCCKNPRGEGTAYLEFFPPLRIPSYLFLNHLAYIRWYVSVC